MDNVFKLKGNSNPKIKSKKNDMKIKIMFDKDDLKDPDAFEHFIKGCENMVRKDPRYKNYKEHLFDLGFTKCTYFGKIDKDMATIEMHHGPIFTLFDICAIVTDSMLAEGERVCVFDVAMAVLQEHDDNHIQIVMLSKTPHQLFHAGKIFINYKQAVGDVMKFIKKYKKGVKPEYLYTLGKYLELCESYDSTDNDLLSVTKKLNKIVKKGDE